MKEPFYVFVRTDIRKSGEKFSAWYVQFRDPKTGIMGTAKSLDKLNERLGDKSGKRITSKAKAIRIAQIALDRGLIPFGEQAKEAKQSRKNKADKSRLGYAPAVRHHEIPSIEFGTYAEPFFDYGRCPLIMEKVAYDGSVTKAYADVCRANLNKHVIPAFKDFQIRDLISVMVDDWLMGFPRKARIQTNTANNCLGVVSQMMDSRRT